MIIKNQQPELSSHNNWMEIQLEQFENGKPLFLKPNQQHLTLKINQLKQEKQFTEILKIAQDMDDSSEKYLIATNALLHLKDWKNLLAYCDRGLKIAEEGEFYHLKGKAIGKLGDHSKKVEYIKKAIELNSEIPAYHRNLGAAYYALKQYDIAAQCHQKAINLEPENPINYHNRGATFFRMQKFEDARHEFERAIEKNPNLALAYSWCGDCYKEEKKFELALQFYSKAYEISNNPIYLQEKQKMQKILQGK